MLHKYKLNGYNIVLDVNSGAVHLLDDTAFDILDYIERGFPRQCPDSVVDEMKDRYSEDNIREAYDELYELYENDMLNSDDDYEKYASMMTLSPVKALCLNIAHDCNLRCEYCFAAKGDFGQGFSRGAGDQ